MCRFGERQKRLWKIAGVNRPNDCSICFVVIVGGGGSGGGDDGNVHCAYTMCSSELFSSYRGGDTPNTVL